MCKFKIQELVQVWNSKFKTLTGSCTLNSKPRVSIFSAPLSPVEIRTAPNFQNQVFSEHAKPIEKKRNWCDNFFNYVQTSVAKGEIYFTA